MAKPTSHGLHGMTAAAKKEWETVHTTPSQKLDSILGSAEAVDREKESQLLAIFALADGEELNRLLSRLALAQLRKLLQKTERLKHTRAALLDIFSAKLGSLSTRSKLAVVKALQHAGLDSLGESLLRDIFLSTTGHELTRLKELVDCGSDGSLDAGFFHRDLHELLFVDVQSEAVRDEVLTHVWAEGMRLRVAEEAPLRRRRREAPPDDGGEWEDVEIAVPPRPDAAAAAAAAFAAAAHPPPESEGTPSAWVRRGTRRHRHIKIISDIDDTLYVGWKDTKFPRGTVYPGVLDFFAALNHKWEDRHRPAHKSSPTPPPREEESEEPPAQSTWGGWMAGLVGGGLGLYTLGCMTTALSGIIQVRSPEEATAQDVARLVDALPDEGPLPIPPDGRASGLAVSSAGLAEEDPAAVEAAAAAEAAEAAQVAAEAAGGPEPGPEVAPFSVTFITARPKLVANLFGKVTRRLLRRKGIVNATVLSGSIDAWLTPQRMENKKYFNFVRYRQLYPEFDFVLVGDSGQRDVQLCESLLARHRPIVAAVLIHDVVATAPADRAALRARGVAFFDTYIGALLEALALGLLDQAAPPEGETSAERPHVAVQELLQRTAASTLEQLRAVRFADPAARAARIAEHNADLARLNALLEPHLRLAPLPLDPPPAPPPPSALQPIEASPESEPNAPRHLTVFI